MFRGTTARTVLSALAVVLLTLSLPAVTPAFAHAYTPRHVEAETSTGIIPSGPAGYAEAAAPHAGATPACGDPTGPPPHRDRHRTARSAPEAAARPLPEPERAPGAGPDAGVPAGHARAPRPSAAHSPAALQVFRC
ncbi:hypothetical protein ACWC10_18660 [Streptomyces sp. NPDC001595]|uniref:hypothetical protein n=1 Tax=Streptomyces sp. NPDC001532 TaxID=3154520 RepID=UPI00331CDE9C